MPLTRVASFLKGITSGLASRFNHECPSLPTASATGPEVLSWPQFALTAVNGPQRRTSSAELEESQLTSCICDLGSVGDEASTLESDVLPREMTKKELYIHDDEIKQAKTLGVGFASHAIELVVLSALRERSTVKKSMADLNVSLFNMHTTRLADILLRRNVGSLCLVEASHNNAKLVKEYARKVRKTEGRKVEAYQADFGSLFPVYTRKRQTPLPAKLLFGDKALIKDAHNPLLLRRQMDGDESGENSAQSPVIIGTFPLPTQQSAMLDSLTSTVIMHHCHLSSTTIFKYGVVHLVTFLSAGNYAAAMCAIDEDLRFMSNAQRHQSWLLNRLFEVKSLRDRKGFSRNTFSPVIPLQKTIAYEKKLAEVGIRNGLMYGVSIRPRCSLQIGPLTVVSSVGAESAAGEVINASEVLLKYAFWLAITGKLTAKTNVYDRLRQWFPESGSKIASEIGSTTKVTDLELRNFDVLFNILHNDMNETCALNNEMAKFIAKFKPASTSKKFAD